MSHDKLHDDSPCPARARAGQPRMPCQRTFGEQRCTFCQRELPLTHPTFVSEVAERWRAANPGAEELARAFAQVHGFGALHHFRLLLPATGWVVRWYYDGVLQLQTMHMRVHEGQRIDLRAPADSVVVVVEVDDGGGFMPYGAVRE